MKNKDLKKGRESIIGKIIYGFLLFMPLLAILTTCLYTIFNKNAYLSTSGNYQVQTTNYVNNLQANNIPTGEEITYYFTTNLNEHDTGFSGWFYFEDISLTLQYVDTDSFRIRYTDKKIQFHRTNNTYYDTTAENFTFTLDSYTNSDTGLTYCTNIYFITYANTDKLDNVFYYSVEKVEQSTLFNWATNSIIYTGISNTCTQLGITNTFVPMLLAYWLLISVVYILYDIILMILIILHNRVHRLQDSMN